MPHSVHASSSPPPSDNELPDAPSSSIEDSSDSQNGNAQGAEHDATAEANRRTNLAEMFDDDEEDEYTSSAPTSSLPQPPPAQGHDTSYTDPGVMRAFYQRLLPYRYLFQWLNHSPQPTTDFAHREFAFTLPSDIYVRYQSFQTADLFRKALTTSLPSRFEIGPVYSTNPRDRKSLRPGATFKPLSKELVLDIDMSDYDAIRTCCTGASVCSKCWAWMRAAMTVLDAALREDFGWRHILWVYSGRRGVHAWVCDRSARELDDRARTAVANYLEVLRGDGAKRLNLRRPLHPHVERALNTLRETFSQDILRVQDPWRTPQAAQTLLSLLPDAKLAAALSAHWSASPTPPSSTQKWNDIDAFAASSSNTSPEFSPKKLKEAKQEILLLYTYPRLDVAVSKQRNHLLKAPFCVHPKTGRICVPIPGGMWGSWDPEGVPTVTELLGEVDRWVGTGMRDGEGDVEMGEGGGADGRAGEGKKGEGEARRIQDWEKTRLKPYVEFFRTFVNDLMKEEAELKTGLKRKGEGGMEF